MSAYLCFVYVRQDSVPELRALACEYDVDVERSVAETLREWHALPHRIEVMTGDRVVVSAYGSQLSRLDACGPGWSAMKPA